MFRSILNFLIIVILAALGVYGASYIRAHRIRLEPRTKAELPPVPVRAARAQAAGAGAAAVVKGVVEPLATVRVSPETAGKVVFVAPGLDLGVTVKEGELLLKLDTELLTAEKRRLEVSLRSAKIGVDSAELDVRRIKNELETANENLAVVARIYERSKRLYESGNLSRTEFDRAELEYIQARRAVRSAQDSLALAEAGLRSASAAVEEVAAALEKVLTSIRKSSVYAPFDAVVTSKNVEKGDYIAPGSPALVLQRIDKVYFTASVPAEEFLRLQKGSQAEVRFYDAERGPFRGKVAFLGVSPDPASRSYPVKILLDNSDLFLRPGLFGEARLTLDPVHFALSVPSTAVQNDGERHFVFVIENSAVHLRYVEIGRAFDRIEILDGLKEGELVAVSAFDRLFPEVKVTVVENDSSAGER